MRSEGASAGGFHAGELAMQRRAGVEAEGARLTPMLAPAELRGGLAAFLAERTFAVLTARDEAGRLWASPLTGLAGFLAVTSPTTLRVTAPIPPGDPLHGLPSGQRAGLIAVEFATRRRFRLNGTLTEARDGRLSFDVDQAFGNCPQYIQQRVLEANVDASAAGPETDQVKARTGSALTVADAELIRKADTFFLGRNIPGGAPTPPTGAVRRASSASRAISSGGRTIPATTCSTASATSRSIRRPRCCSSVSAPGRRCTCPAPLPSNGGSPARRATMAAPAVASASPCTAWSPAIP
jgi:predicted pyridoxine 5'-phosphate oxidase superfamily flavin-nucleotide-binding protein